MKITLEYPKTNPTLNRLTFGLAQWIDTKIWEQAAREVARTAPAKRKRRARTIH